MSQFDDAIAAMITRHGTAWRSYTAENFQEIGRGEGRLTRGEISLLTSLITNPRPGLTIENLKPPGVDLATFAAIINHESARLGIHDELTDAFVAGGLINSRTGQPVTLQEADRSRITAPVTTFDLRIDRGVEVTATFDEPVERTLPADIISELYWAREILNTDLRPHDIAPPLGVMTPQDAVTVPRSVVNGLTGTTVLPQRPNREQVIDFVFAEGADPSDPRPDLNNAFYMDDNYAAMIGYSIGVDPTYSPTNAQGVPIDIEWNGTERELADTVRAIYDENDGPGGTDRQVPFREALAAMAEVGRRHQRELGRFDFESVVGAGPAPRQRSDLAPPVVEEMARAA